MDQNIHIPRGDKLTITVEKIAFESMEPVFQLRILSGSDAFLAHEITLSSTDITVLADALHAAHHQAWATEAEELGV